MVEEILRWRAKEQLRGEMEYVITNKGVTKYPVNKNGEVSNLIKMLVKFFKVVYSISPQSSYLYFKNFNVTNSFSAKGSSIILKSNRLLGKDFIVITNENSKEVRTVLKRFIKEE